MSRVVAISTFLNAQIDQSFSKVVEKLAHDYDRFELTIERVNDPPALNGGFYRRAIQSPHSFRRNGTVKSNFTSAILYPHKLENRVDQDDAIYTQRSNLIIARELRTRSWRLVHRWSQSKKHLIGTVRSNTDENDDENFISSEKYRFHHLWRKFFNDTLPRYRNVRVSFHLPDSLKS